MLAGASSKGPASAELDENAGDFDPQPARLTASAMAQTLHALRANAFSVLTVLRETLEQLFVTSLLFAKSLKLRSSYIGIT